MMRYFKVFLTVLMVFAITSSVEARIIVGPYLQNPTNSQITVCWISNDGGKSEILYGNNLKHVTQGKEGLFYPTFGSYLHEVRVIGLQTATSYPYRVRSGGTQSSVYTFQTAPPGGSPISFLAISDAQGKPDFPSTIAAVGKLVHPDIIIFSGDLAENADHASDWYSGPRSFFDVMTGVQPGAPLLQYIPLFPTVGNHEYPKPPEKETLNTYLALFSLPGNERYYSHDYGNVHFVHLNVTRRFSNKPFTEPRYILSDPITPDSPQYKWLSEDLSGNLRRWTVVSLHHPIIAARPWIMPPFCEPVRTDDGTYTYPKDVLFDELRLLLEQKGVDLVLWGHRHVYEHYFLNKIHYIEASCIGNTYRLLGNKYGVIPIYQNTEDRSFVFVQTSNSQMEVTLYRSCDGAILESFQIEK